MTRLDYNLKNVGYAYKVNLMKLHKIDSLLLVDAPGASNIYMNNVLSNGFKKADKKKSTQ